jgi:hypothetical protein
VHQFFLSRFLKIKGSNLGDIYMSVGCSIVSAVNMYININLMLEKD